MAFNYTREHVHHAVVMFVSIAVMKKLTSASRIILFPSGQMTWSTWERTLSQVSSGVRRLACRGWKRQSHLRPFRSETFRWAFLVRLYAAAAYHVDLRVWVAHVAHNAAVFHPVQLVSGHHVLVPCKETKINHLLLKIYWEAIKMFLCMSVFLEAQLEVQLPVHVMMTSTWRMTSFSLTTRNPSMLERMRKGDDT